MAQLKLVLNRTEVKAAETVKPSARIGLARTILEELLMLDEEENLLIGVVSEPLNEIRVQLSALEGQQTLYERWVG